ncbi:hypothetical protein MRB53_022200 [Persea americana]|uniref:Uncharacterized protein n=1 Tax=Persea americana TaxID=3435 RepID=A0ACC2L703_PERAE|nr:hypothetical protein MRB53_022200 [Persea americana]
MLTLKSDQVQVSLIYVATRLRTEEEETKWEKGEGYSRSSEHIPIVQTALCRWRWRSIAAPGHFLPPSSDPTIPQNHLSSPVDQIIYLKVDGFQIPVPSA